MAVCLCPSPCEGGCYSKIYITNLAFRKIACLHDIKALLGLSHVLACVFPFTGMVLHMKEGVSECVMYTMD